MVNKLLLGVLGVVVAVQAMDPVLTEITVKDDSSIDTTATYGDYVYTGYTSKALGIYNVANPMSPVLVKRFDVNEPSYRVQVVGTILYVRRRTTVDTYIITDPSNPVFAARYTTGCTVFGDNVDFAFSGDYLYIACPDKLITLLTDTSGSLTFVKETAVGGYANAMNRVAALGSTVLFVHQDTSITAFDITDPANPVKTLTQSGYGPDYSTTTCKVINGYLYIGGGNGDLKNNGQTIWKVDPTTLDLIPLTIPTELASSVFYMSVIEADDTYLYVSGELSYVLYVLREDANVLTFIEQHTVGSNLGVEVVGKQLIATSSEGKWWIFSIASASTTVLINGEVIEGTHLAGAATYKKGAKQLGEISENFRSMKVHMPAGDVSAGSVMELKCQGGEVCSFILSHYHCPPCSGPVNGGFPKDLPLAGFQTGSCAPKYGPTEERMTSYKVEVQAGETLTLNPLSVDATSFTVFSQQGAFASAWCPARNKKPGCGGPCPPPKPCVCLDN